MTVRGVSRGQRFVVDGRPRRAGSVWPGTARRKPAAGRPGLPRGARLAFLVIIAYLVFGFVAQEMKVMALARQVRELERQAESIRVENERLKREIEFAKSDEYIIRVAREELGLVWPNEVPYAPPPVGTTQRTEQPGGSGGSRTGP
ncbi:MAG: septum formation initiator family protein [Firmicutes bacterium]|nr:septum formation initiator family protein [Bacillota bacterium]